MYCCKACIRSFYRRLCRAMECHRVVALVPARVESVCATHSMRAWDVFLDACNHYIGPRFCDVASDIVVVGFSSSGNSMNLNYNDGHMASFVCLLCVNISRGTFCPTKFPSETKEHIEATRLHNATLPSKE